MITLRLRRGLSFDLSFPKRPTGQARPQDGSVRRPGICFSGFEGEGANQGDVSRPEQSGGRVTATEKEDDRPRPPVSDEGGDRRQAGHHGAGERSVRGFSRSRSRPQRPRTGSPSKARSAGTGQRRSTKCWRGWPVAAQRSSGPPRRQGGSPNGADGRGYKRPERRRGAQRSPAPTDDGDREGGPGRKARQAVHQAGRERRRGATPATATPDAYQTDL